MNQVQKAKADRIKRAKRLMALFDKSVSLADLAAAEGCSKQRVSALIKSVRPAKPAGKPGAKRQHR